MSRCAALRSSAGRQDLGEELKHFVAYPVDPAGRAASLPLLLSTKRERAMEAEDARVLAGAGAAAGEGSDGGGRAAASLEELRAAAAAHDARCDRVLHAAGAGQRAGTA